MLRLAASLYYAGPESPDQGKNAAWEMKAWNVLSDWGAAIPMVGKEQGVEGPLLLP